MPAIVDPRFAARMKQLRQRGGLSIRRLAAIVHYSKTYLHQIESGVRTPTRDVAARLDAALDSDGELSAMVHDVPDVVGSERIEFAATHPRRLDRAAVQDLEDLLAVQRRLEDSVGAAPMVVPVRAQLAMIGRLVRASPDDHIRPRLLDVAGQWAHLAGWLHTTTGDLDAGRAWYMRAMEWGTEAGNPHLVATILSMRGHLAWILGHNRGAVELSRAAAWHPASLGVRSLAMQQEARGLALLGDAAASDELLDRAEEMAIRSADRRENEPPWMYFYDPAFFALTRGLAQMYLGRDETAVDLLVAGLDGLPLNIRRSDWIGWYLVQLAKARRGVGDVDGALMALEEARIVAAATGHTRLTGDVGAAAREFT